MNGSIELDDKRREALERTARRHKSSVQQLLEQAVDVFIERVEDEELLEESARVAKRTGLRERDAAQIVRDWRQNQNIDLDKILEIDSETASRIRECAATRQCSIQEAISWLLKLGAETGEGYCYLYWEGRDEKSQDRKAG
ncbi:MAG: hypothetical protein ACJ74J_18930 [Blastocatellia bacterium]